MRSVDEAGSFGKTFRWSASLTWGAGPRAAWLLAMPAPIQLPTSAGVEADDVLMEACEQVTRQLGYAGLDVVYLFPRRSPGMAETAAWLLTGGASAARVMNINRRAVADVANGSAIRIVAFGDVMASCRPAAMDVVRAFGGPAFCLGLTGTGQPILPGRRADEGGDMLHPFVESGCCRPLMTGRDRSRISDGLPFASDARRTLS